MKESIGSRRNFPVELQPHGLNTLPIQLAIDACSEAGGGTVTIPPGRFRIGTVLLRNNVNLHLESGAVLEGSSDLAHYSAALDGFVDAVGQRRSRCLVAAANAHRVSISGRGAIDGRGGTFARDLDNRPFLVRFIGCRDVTMTDVTLCDSAAWVSHFMECDNVQVRGVTIRSRVNGNNDGIDVDACRNVRISDCDIDTGDDAICIKSTTGGACRNVSVSHCILKSDWAALKLGTESAGDFQNIILSHCVIYDTNGGGLKLITTDGGRMENVLVSDLIMHRVSGPIFIRLGNRLRSYRGEAPKSVGCIRNITLRGIRADVWEEGSALWGKTRRAGICITGVAEQSIEGLTLADIHLTFPGGGTWGEANALDVPELGDHYPEFTIFTPLPAYGFYVRHAKNVMFRAIRMETREPDARPALVMDDVEEVSLADWDAAAPENHVRARLRNARQVSVPWRNPALPTSTQSDGWEQW